MAEKLSESVVLQLSITGVNDDTHKINIRNVDPKFTTSDIATSTLNAIANSYMAIYDDDTLGADASLSADDSYYTQADAVIVVTSKYENSSVSSQSSRRS